MGWLSSVVPQCMSMLSIVWSKRHPFSCTAQTQQPERVDWVGCYGPTAALAHSAVAIPPSTSNCQLICCFVPPLTRMRCT